MSKYSRALRLGAKARSRLSAVTLLVGLAFASAGCERKPDSSGAASPDQTAARVGILPEGAAPPNVFVILIDALRADRLRAYGNRNPLTPTMDQIAEEGVTFEHCISASPWTLPSVATLFTSYYPGVHDATSYRVVSGMEEGRQAVQSVLSDDFDTLAEVLQRSGYQTAGLVAAKFLRAGYGFGQGFDHYDTSFAANTVRGDQVNQALFQWLDEGRDPSRPMFVYLHYMDVHGPYNAAPRFMDPLMEQLEAYPNKTLLEPKQFKTLNPYLQKPPPETSDPGRYERLKGYREYWVARYDAGVAEMDFYLSQLVHNLKQRGLWDDAYVILTADHGEALCEHGLWEHGYSQYQTDLHVPLVLRWPNVLPAGKRVRRLASLIDLMPTLLEQLRISSAENLQGSSLVDHLSGTLPDVPLMRFAEATKSGPEQYAIFVDVTKLIVTAVPPRRLPDGTMSEHGERHELFNLGTDPEEMYNVSAQNAAVVKQLEPLMIKIIQENMRTKPEVVVTQKPVDQQDMRDLESLGYVGTSEEDEEPNEPEPASQPADEVEGDSDDDHP
ncbi:MAG: sulfatase [Planctomycetes bacterium]|nr:sulfatase [Planctomycetota bacterium]